MKFGTTFKTGMIAAGVAAAGLMGAQSALAVSVKVEQFVEAKDPWGMAAMKDGTFFFTEKCAGLSVRTASGSVNKLLGIGGSTGFSAVKNDLFCDGQAGVLGVAVDPEFDKNRFVYLRSTSKGDNRAFGGYANILMRMKVSADMKSVSEVTEIINDMGYKPKKSNHPFGGPGAHNGGALAFGPDGFLYVTIGDNHSGPGPQDGTKLVGKVLRVDRDGKAAAGNKPPAGFDQRIFTYGHRNPQGIAFRPSGFVNAGRPYLCEHGPGNNDEVTPLTAGGNGGWDPRPKGTPLRCPDGSSNSYCGYNGSRMTDTVTYPQALPPAWTTGNVSQGMSGCGFVSGTAWRDWNGALAVALLSGRRVEILRLNSDGTTATNTPILNTLNERLRLAHLGPDGALYVLTDGKSGGDEIWRLVPD
jgi:glucose/arabinose dehydrogenase